MLSFKKWLSESTRTSSSFADDELMPVDTRTIGALPFYSQEDKPETLRKDPRIRKKKSAEKHNPLDNSLAKIPNRGLVRMELGSDT